MHARLPCADGWWHLGACSDEAMSSDDAIADLLQPVAPHSRSMGKPQVAELHHLARCMAVVSRERYTELLAMARMTGGPLMQFHASDGWSCDTLRTEVTKLVNGKTIQRKGRRRSEYLLELILLKTLDMNGRVQQSLRFYAPRELKSKKGWAVFASSLDCPSLLHEKIANIRIQVCVQDGAHCVGNTKKQLAWQKVCASTSEEAEELPDDDSHSHRCWTFGWRCILHVYQSGFKWAVAPYLTEALSHDAHLVIKSLLNSSGPIMDRVDDFLSTRLHYDDERDPSTSTYASFWVLLGVDDPAMLQRILDVNPWWDRANQILRVSSSLKRAPDQGFAQIKGIVLYCLRWKNWSDTRWGMMPHCSRLYLRSRAVGVEYLAQMVTDDRQSSSDKEYLGGYQRFICSDIEKLFTIAAVALRPLERGIDRYMEDRIR